MPQVQVNTKRLPILIQPRINNIERDVAWIKINQSFLYANDVDTPMVFSLHYKKRGDADYTTITADPVQSTPSILYFNMPDSFYSITEKWSLLFSWKVTKADPPNPDIIEQVFTEKPITLEVKDVGKI